MHIYSRETRRKAVEGILLQCLTDLLSITGGRVTENLGAYRPKRSKTIFENFTTINSSMDYRNFNEIIEKLRNICGKICEDLYQDSVFISLKGDLASATDFFNPLTENKRYSVQEVKKSNTEKSFTGPLDLPGIGTYVRNETGKWIKKD